MQLRAAMVVEDEKFGSLERDLEQSVAELFRDTMMVYK